MNQIEKIDLKEKYLRWLTNELTGFTIAYKVNHVLTDAEVEYLDTLNLEVYEKQHRMIY